MPSTPTYGLRYPALSDPPNGPAQIGNLAADTETALTGVAATVATKAASHRLLSSVVFTTDTGSVTGTEVIVMSTTFTSLGTSEIYRVEFQGTLYTGSATASNANLNFRWRTGNVTLVNTDASVGGTQLLVAPLTVFVPVSVSYTFTGVPAGIATVGFGMNSSNGQATVVHGQSGPPVSQRILRVWDEGV